MKRFKLYNNIAGWVVFAIAAVTYLMTIEPTASFWDCGEFISTANKLEVGHPPGAPFFMLTARIFTLFASDQQHVAMMVNAFSALCSAFCILFLFWTITHIARKLVLESEDQEVSNAQLITILGAGAVGALAYTFSDTFWFSAVEGEVYAYSSLFTAVVFWAILKWEDVADKPFANRWLVLIAYLMGLSIGVHLLNLLTIPALVFVYYFKKNKATVKGTFFALGVSVVILVMVLYGIIPGFVEVAGWFELFFVNVLGFSFNTGTIIYAVLLIGCLIWGIWETMFRPYTWKNRDAFYITAFTLSILLLGIPFLGGRINIFVGLLITAAVTLFLIYGKKLYDKSVLNTILICCTVILLGYSSYAAIIIRSAANTPMDQNSPDDVFALKSYLNREQYGDTPLLYGETYASEYKWDKNGNPDFTEGETQYAKKVKTNPNQKDEYEDYDTKKNYKHQLNMLFPRMYSTQAHHIAGYKMWGKIKGKKATYLNREGERKTKVVPTFGENLTYFFNYQVNFMYWRYFLWNFVGRQNDIQADGGDVYGNWITGINFIDSLMLGNQDNLPDDMKNNKGRNTYYGIPLLLGILGLVYQYSRKKKENPSAGVQSFVVTFTLFFMTGLAIVLYLNQTPLQPRERDYAYAGSFYAFCIWIGLSVPAIMELFLRKINTNISAIIATLIGLLGAPTLMASQNWDDHDRSGRYTCRDFGQNYLLTMAPNGVIFTNGDNDTFPLWYNQEVEGVGEDARVANLSYLQMGWYVDQMKRDAYASKALPISLHPKDYMNGRMDYAEIVDLVGGEAIDLKKANQILVDNDINLRRKILRNPDQKFWFYPARNLTLDVNTKDVIKYNAVEPKDIPNIVPTMHIGFPSSKRYLGKQEIFILDLLANNNWERPLYFATTVGKESFTGLNDYLQLEGMAYRIVPVKKNPLISGEIINTEKMYDNMLHKFKWGGIAENPDIYLEENNLRMTSTLRLMFLRLVDGLLLEATQATTKRDYCELLSWALHDNRDNRYMNTFRNYSAMYFNNSMITSPQRYSDSMLISNARTSAIEILGQESRLKSNEELAVAIRSYGNAIDTSKARTFANERKQRAIEVLDYAHKVLPAPQVPLTTISLMMAKQYDELGQYEKAKPTLEAMKKSALQHLAWISGMDPQRQRKTSESEVFTEHFRILHEIISIEKAHNEPYAEEDDKLLDKYYPIYQKMMN
ncbi:MAG: DUF2723 domain-containing protein [Paludibacteraceae bacterium]|nr:DUF2723 domain-containing protein [Paludibacteraceae bacterium]